MRLGVCAMVVFSSLQVCEAFPGAISWTEDFSTDPIASGRWKVPAGQDYSRFSYDSASHFLTVHYDTFLPTAFCEHAVDPVSGRGICRTRDFEYEVTFRIRSAGFFADPDGFAQIGWGMINSVTTGGNRAGYDPPGPPYSFDVMTFDYFPNVSVQFGGPTLAATAIHSDIGQGYYGAFEFPFGAESDLNQDLGDETIALDTEYTATVAFSAANQMLVARVRHGENYLNIDADGSGGPGGPDGDATTIQTFFYADDPLAMDRFALTAWQDSGSPAGASVVADVDILAVSFSAPPSDKGDVNGDGAIDGRDISAFVQTVVSSSPDPQQVARADMNFDGSATLSDLPRFVEALLCP